MGWMRGLALRLVRDATRAEDVAQEALARILARPPVRARGGPSLRAFLATLTRLVARDARRSEARRGRRERGAARSEALPSTLDVVELNALVQQASAAVMALDEPYRSTVLYRYLDGLTSVQIAERMGATPAAVRKRLSRALTELRSRLEAQWGGSTEGWLWALVPAGARDATAVAKQALGAKGVLMFGKLQAMAGVAVVAGTAVAVGGLREGVELETPASAPPEMRIPLLAGADPSRARSQEGEPLVAPRRADLPRSSALGAPGGRGGGARRPVAITTLPSQRSVLTDVDLARTAELTDRLVSLAIVEGRPSCLGQDGDTLDPSSCTDCHQQPDVRAFYSLHLPQETPLDGLHTERYDGGQPSAQGTLRNGRRSAAWSEWYPDGGIQAQGAYYDGDRQDWWTHYHPGGAKSAEGAYLYGEREGAWSEYGADGARVRAASYRNGKLSGVVRTWHPGGGVLASEVEHYAGEADGPAATWYPDGTRESRGHQRRGEQVGVWTYWHPDGKKDGQRSGPVQ